MGHGFRFLLPPFLYYPPDVTKALLEAGASLSAVDNEVIKHSVKLTVGKPRTDSVPPTMQSQIPKSRDVTLFFLDITLYK